MKKYIFIDVDDTILDFHACAEHAIQMGFTEHKIACSDFAETYHRINDGLWRALERGEITRQQLYATRFNLVFAELGVDFDGEVFETTFRRNLALTGDKMDGAEEIMGYLSDKYDVYVTSNAPQAQQESRLRIAQLDGYVRGVFTSEQLNVQKPQKQFFDECLRRIGNVLADEVVLIGDSLSADVAGGANAGITTIWFNSKNIPIPDDFAGDYVISHLTEIKNIL